MVPWREAWHDALYGPRGFYRRRRGPGRALHDVDARPARRRPSPTPSGGSPTARACTTSSTSGAAAASCSPTCAARRPDLRLTGVDVVARPDDLPDAVAWLRSPGGGALPAELTDLDDVLVVAHEWLDVVPCTVAEVVAPGRLAVVLVDPATGRGGDRRRADRRRAGLVRAALAGRRAARRGAGRGRPDPRPGVGRPRRPGARRHPARRRLRPHRAVTGPTGGTLTAYRGGVPGGAGARRVVRPHGPRRRRLARARRAHHPAGGAARARASTAGTPDHDLARTDPAGYLAALARGLGGRRADRPGGPGRLRLGAAPRARGCDSGRWSVAPWWGCDSGCRVPPSRSPSWPARA